MLKTFLFQAIQFSISMSLVLFNPYVGPLSGATKPGQSGPGNNGNKRVLRIPQSFSITGTSPSDGLVSYPVHWLGWGVTPLQPTKQFIVEKSAQKSIAF